LPSGRGEGPVGGSPRPASASAVTPWPGRAARLTGPPFQCPRCRRPRPLRARIGATVAVARRVRADAGRDPWEGPRIGSTAGAVPPRRSQSGPIRRADSAILSARAVAADTHRCRGPDGAGCFKPVWNTHIRVLICIIGIDVGIGSVCDQASVRRGEFGPHLAAAFRPVGMARCRP